MSREPLVLENIVCVSVFTGPLCILWHSRVYSSRGFEKPRCGSYLSTLIFECFCGWYTGTPFVSCNSVSERKIRVHSVFSFCIFLNWERWMSFLQIKNVLDEAFPSFHLHLYVFIFFQGIQICIVIVLLYLSIQFFSFWNGNNRESTLLSNLKCLYRCSTHLIIENQFVSSYKIDVDM